VRKIYSPDEVLEFWFPARMEQDHAAMAGRMEWWFRGGADPGILARFAPLTAAAAYGEYDHWSKDARSRLALIVVLDQFSRTVYRGTARAYEQDPKARAAVREGIANGHYEALGDPWKKTFFVLPLGHSEDLADLDWVVQLTEDLAYEGPEEHRRLLEFSASQARAHRDVVAQFGRQPHRNEILRRQSTSEELEYLARNQLVHQRAVPS
jgi:uncharacterized protein (DUF924 family)